MHKVVNNL